MRLGLGLARIWAAAVLAGACSPTVAPVGADLDAATDLAELVDESDSGVTDAADDTSFCFLLPTLCEDAVDKPDVVDVALPPDVPKDVPDVPDAIVALDCGPDTGDVSGDLPPLVPDAEDAMIACWLAAENSLSSLGVIPDTCPCGNVYLKVKPFDPPQGPPAACGCPAPYPSTCGTCPWIETPPMHWAREDAEALWTGEEVLIMGGRLESGLPGDKFDLPFTMERWNPSKDQGFQMVDLPFTITQVAGSPPWVRAVWSGEEAIVIMENQQFRFNPKTNVVTVMPEPPVKIAPSADGGHVYWVGDQLILWGVDRATFKPNGPNTGRIVSWTIKNGWQDVPPPSDFVTYFAGPKCQTVLDGALYALEPGLLKPSTGGDVNKPFMLRYTLQSKVWELMPQTMLPDLHCDNGNNENVLFGAFPGGIAFIPPIGDKLFPPVGEIWTKATGKWAAMKTPPIKVGIATDNRPKWTGSEFIVPNVGFVDPVTDGKLPKNGPVHDPATWPLRYNPATDTFGYFTSVGFPKFGRFRPSWVYAGTELMALGGTNGIGLAITYHKDGVRLWLPHGGVQ